MAGKMGGNLWIPYNSAQWPMLNLGVESTSAWSLTTVWWSIWIVLVPICQ